MGIPGMPTSVHGLSWDAHVSRRILDRSSGVLDSHPVSAREADRPGHRISLRISDELYAQVRKLAERDRRAVATWIKILIEDAVSAARDSTAGTGTRKR
jgi:hypothetical protein